MAIATNSYYTPKDLRFSTSYSDELQSEYKTLADALYDDYLTSSQDATAQAYALKRKQQQDAEQSFYNQLYDTNATVLDTIRRNNASAIATGASKGAQAANELSAMLQGQQASVDAATQLAQSNYDLASEEAEAYINAEQAARQQADTAAGTLAGNLAVAMQADAALQSAELNADAVERTSEITQLTNAVREYLNATDETTKNTNRLIIEALTGQKVDALGIKPPTTETVDSSKQDVETIVAKYNPIINKANNPTIAKQYIKQAIEASNTYGNTLVTEVSGKSNKDLEKGYHFDIEYNGYYLKGLRISLSGQIGYSDIKNDILKATVDNAPDGFIMQIDGDYFVVDKTGNKTPKLQRLYPESYKNYLLTSDNVFKYAPNFTNKKNN